MATPATAFHYDEFVSRNLGFVTASEQEHLRAGRVFVCGAGGMGGAALQSLIRAGVGHVAVADADRFELSNLNRQVFASLETLGRSKVAVAADAARSVNPEIAIETYGAEWMDRIDDLLTRYPIVINAMDDLRAGLQLYRKASELGATVIDAYTSPLPSVTVVRPAAPRPEERLGFPTVGRPLDAISAAELAGCLERELEYVLVHSSAANHIDPTFAREFMAGWRRRPSFAPMVITTGNLMCFEAIKLILGRDGVVDERGYCFNPWTGSVERPHGVVVAMLRRRMVRRVMRKLGS